MPATPMKCMPLRLLSSAAFPRSAVRASLLGTVVGAAIWGTLQNGLQFAGAPVAIRNIIIGIIVVLSVLMDVVIRTGRRNTKGSD